jgi:nucleoside-diphosphate-sugar epimerase
MTSSTTRPGPYGAATLTALEDAQRGEIYNVVDDEPVTFGEFFTELATLLGAPPPRRVPVWMGRVLAPYAPALAVDTRLCVSNEKIRRDFSWRPGYPTYPKS